MFKIFYVGNHLVPKVLELYKGVLAVPPHNGLHELVDEVVVAGN